MTVTYGVRGDQTQASLSLTACCSKSVSRLIIWLFCRSSPSDSTRRFDSMAPKEAFKPKPSAKSEKNKPKGGKAKDEKRAADKAKKEAKSGGGVISLGGKK